MSYDAAQSRESGVTGVRRAVKGVVDFYWGSGLSDDVPALAWYLISAVAPLILGIAAIATIVLGDGAQVDAVARHVAHVLPAATREQVIALVLRTRRDSPLLLAIAVASMTWAGAGATGVVERAESRLLAVPRRGPVALMLRPLGLALGMALMIAVMAIAGVEATNLRSRIGITIPGWLLSLGAVAVIALICGLLYRFATTRRIAWRAALGGGLPAAVIVELTPLLAGYYARAVAGRTPVGVFLVLAGLLFTCYIVALGLLIGAGLAVSFQRKLDHTTDELADGSTSRDTTAGGRVAPAARDT